MSTIDRPFPVRFPGRHVTAGSWISGTFGGREVISGDEHYCFFCRRTAICEGVIEAGDAVISKG